MKIKKRILSPEEYVKLEQKWRRATFHKGEPLTEEEDADLTIARIALKRRGLIPIYAG